MKYIRAILFILAALAVFVLVGITTPSIAAQEAAATVEATAEPVVEGPVVINVNPSEGQTSDNTPVAYLALAVSAFVGVIVSISLVLQVIGNRAQAISDNPAVLATLEQGYEGVVPDIVKAAIAPLKESLERSDRALESVLELVKKLTDGVPEAAKPPTEINTPGKRSDYDAPTTSVAGFTPPTTFLP